MPITDGKYVNPGWRNKMAPAIAQQELQNLCDTLEDALWPELFVTLADTGTTVTATKGSTTVTLTETDGVWFGVLDSLGTWTVTGLIDGESVSNSVEVETVGQYSLALQAPIPEDINDASWNVISSVAQAGTAASYWSIGDCKSVTLNGTMGTLSLNTTLYVYIIGINHRGTNGITFQGFKTAKSGGVDVCLVGPNYSSDFRDGTKTFNVNHWGTSSAPNNTNYGGWAACDMRYDILGSTDVSPTPYGSTKTTTATGSDPTATCATSPVSNTLMSCLPSTLRAVLRPMTVYTDNKGNSGSVAANVTATTDYLPLLAEFEIFGARTYANQYEQNYQSQYDYYAAGNSTVKYRHSATGSTAYWWERSPYYDNAFRFCFVDIDGTASNDTSRGSFGVAPAFMV